MTPNRGDKIIVTTPRDAIPSKPLENDVKNGFGILISNPKSVGILISNQWDFH